MGENVSVEGCPSRGPAISILGCRVDQIDQIGAMETVACFLQEVRRRLVVTADSSMLVRAQHDTELHQILETADLVVPDSIGVVWASRLLGTPLKERVTGVDLVERICEYCAGAGLSVFLLGSASGVAERAAGRLVARYPGLRVAGWRHGFFTDAEDAEVAQTVAAALPDVLFVALGIPRQEKWLARHVPHIPIRIGMGVGGSLDVLAGEVKRAPAFFRAANLEWLYRVGSDPRRYRKGLMLPIFVWLALKEWFHRKRRSS